MLSLLMDLKVSAKTINETTAKIGNELQQVRDEQADNYGVRPLTTPPTQAAPPISLACVEIDGGRMQTRTPGEGAGVHNPHWRENKNAGFFRMTGDSDRFGELMAAEADRRGFYSAPRQSFLGDGLPYNWAIQREHFPSFTPILDFIHPIERLHETSRVLFSDSEQAWKGCMKWMALCWAGDTNEVIGQLEAEQAAVGLPDDDTPDGDVRQVLAETLTYLRNSVSRMDYPAYPSRVA